MMGFGFLLMLLLILIPWLASWYWPSGCTTPTGKGRHSARIIP
jgi:hypothetical protein